MNGLGFLLVASIGAIAGVTFMRLRRGGTLDLRTCLTTGHDWPLEEYGQCPRCGVRVIAVAP